MNIAFNAPFDKRMLEKSRHIFALGTMCQTAQLSNHEGKQRCPTEPVGGLKQPNLTEACNYFGVALPKNAHRALDDARATAHLVCAIHRMDREAYANRSQTAACPFQQCG